MIAYFSSVSGNTKRFVEAIGLPAQRIPLLPLDGHLSVTEPYVLVVPTYGGGHARGAVPKQVIKFLNDVHNRELIRGVVTCGNTNFGAGYGLAGPIIARKTGAPLLGTIEVFGMPGDAERMHDAIRDVLLPPEAGYNRV